MGNPGAVDVGGAAKDENPPGWDGFHELQRALGLLLVLLGFRV